MLRIFAKVYQDSSGSDGYFSVSTPRPSQLHQTEAQLQPVLYIGFCEKFFLKKKSVLKLKIYLKTISLKKSTSYRNKGLQFYIETLPCVNIMTL